MTQFYGMQNWKIAGGGVINFLELVGRNGIILKANKFQFAQKAVEFAGFHIGR